MGSMAGRSTRSLDIVKTATVDQFAHLKEQRILRFSKRFKFLRIGGFVVGVVIPLGVLIWGVASEEFDTAVPCLRAASCDRFGWVHRILVHTVAMCGLWG